jgi:hypothetical protein
VALSDNVSVTPELADHGAKTFTAEESQQLVWRQRLPWIVGGAALLVVGALAAVAISMASEPQVVVHRQQRPAVVAPAPKAAVAAPANSSDTDSAGDDEDLLATPTRSKRAHAQLKMGKPADTRNAAADKGEKAEKQSDSALGVGERDPDLDDADAPLKRPMF